MPDTRHKFLTKLVAHIFFFTFYVLISTPVPAHIGESASSVDGTQISRSGNVEARFTLHVHAAAPTADLEFFSRETSKSLDSASVSAEIIGGKQLQPRQTATGAYLLSDFPDAPTSFTLLIEQQADGELNMFSFDVSLPSPPTVQRSKAVDRAMYVLITFNVVMVTVAALTMFAWYRRDRKGRQGPS